MQQMPYAIMTHAIGSTSRVCKVSANKWDESKHTWRSQQ